MIILNDTDFDKLFNDSSNRSPIVDFTISLTDDDLKIIKFILDDVEYVRENYTN